MQPFTCCFAMDHRPGEDHTIDKPGEYSVWFLYWMQSRAREATGGREDIVGAEEGLAYPYIRESRASALSSPCSNNTWALMQE